MTIIEIFLWMGLGAAIALSLLASYTMWVITKQEKPE